MYVLAVLIPPLAILLSGRPFQAVFNAALWAIGLVLLILPFVPGLLTWALSAAWAIAVVRSRNQSLRDRRLVQDALKERDRERAFR